MQIVECSWLQRPSASSNFGTANSAARCCHQSSWLPRSVSMSSLPATVECQLRPRQDTLREISPGGSSIQSSARYNTRAHFVRRVNRPAPAICGFADHVFKNLHGANFIFHVIQRWSRLVYLWNLLMHSK